MLSHKSCTSVNKAGKIYIHIPYTIYVDGIWKEETRRGSKYFNDWRFWGKTRLVFKDALSSCDWWEELRVRYYLAGMRQGWFLHKFPYLPQWTVTESGVYGPWVIFCLGPGRERGECTVLGLKKILAPRGGPHRSVFSLSLLTSPSPAQPQPCQD